MKKIYIILAVLLLILEAAKSQSYLLNEDFFEC